jgi:putative spermidine/putrescine transport system permease protein
MALASVGLLGTFPGLLLAHTLLGIPYVVLIMSVAIRSFDGRIEQVALTLGASWIVMFTRILLPNLLPSAIAAWIFAFVTSFDEVVVTNFIAGAYETIPKRMFNELILQVNPGITAIATALIAVSVVLMALAAWVNHYQRARSSF